MRLFHIELKIPGALLLRARYPEPPNPRVVAKWDDADYAKEMRRMDAAEKAYGELVEQFIHPALRCLLGAQDLNDLLERCGPDAIVRVSLESLEKVEESDPCIVQRPYPFTIDNRESPLDPPMDPHGSQS